MAEHIYIFDTTLRDGEQCPGASMTSTEKIEIARALARMRVDIIEAGFPIASPDDLAAVQQIAREVGISRNGSFAPVICGLARCAKKDIDAAWEGVKDADRSRIHVFLASSPIHMKYKLRMTPEQVLERTAEMVAYAASKCKDIEFSPEDASRSEPEFLYQMLETAIQAGATTLNIPDTVGYSTPDEFGELIRKIRANTKGIENCIISVHTHDDLGMAVANALAGLKNGARQAEVTVNGIGERAGNAAMEELVMALHTRRSYFNFDTGIETTHISRMSQLVSNFTSFPIPPNKAIIGSNAFAHESGIHQDGVLKNVLTYEIMKPEDVGIKQSSLVLGKHSGRHAMAQRMTEMGYRLSDDEISQLFIKFKELADKKKSISNADLEALVTSDVNQIHTYFALDGLQIACGTIGMPTASVRLTCPDGEIRTHAAIGTGPIDAAFKAIDAIVEIPGILKEFAVHAVTEGIDAVGEVSVRVESDYVASTTNPQNEENRTKIIGGYGAHNDIVVASVKAYLSALNKLIDLSEISNEGAFNG
jgi:2-isopropylmalate synthase